MTAERWAHIKEIFSAAVEMPETDRHAYLESACGGNAELRGEVERLLADHGTQTLNSPAAGVFAQVPTFAPGEMLAQYRVEAKLGEGGMGAVYRAYDTRLQRQVAVKVLLPDPDQKRRLMREARAASALNHPNIVTVHEISSDRGVDFIAMEYVEGRSLDKVIPSKGLPVARALDYAIQIADALEQAHAAGVVHRDLKPANIMVNGGGRIKLLDFGLARRMPMADGATVTLTVPGAVMGTPAYMSPEQAEGRKSDLRTDVFSFGAVLYEMLAGRRAFVGETTVALLAAILHQEPGLLREIAPGVPGELERVVLLCLKKDPARRFQHIGDVRIQLDAIREDTLSGEPVAAAPKGRGRLWALSLTGAAVVLAAMGFAFRLRWSPHPSATPQLIRLTSDSGLTTQPALSPDGKLQAFASDRAGEGNLDIWVQQIDGGVPMRLTRDPANEQSPDFSPDGTRIVFRSEKDGGGVYVIPALGGEARLIASSGSMPRFSPDGSEIAYAVGGMVTSAQGSGIYVASSGGGRPRRLQPDFFDAIRPLWTPDGKHLVFRGIPEVGGAADWWVTPLDGGPANKTGAADIFAQEGRPFTERRQEVGPSPGAWHGGDLVFSEQSGDTTNLWRIPISTTTWRIAGKPRQLTFGVGLNVNARISADGRVVFANLTRNINIWNLPVDASRGKVTGELQHLTHGAAFQLHPSLSPDAKRLAFVANGPTRSEVVLKDLASGREAPVFAVPLNRGYPAFNADGSKIAFSIDGNDRSSIHVVRAGGGVPEMVCEDCGAAPAWSTDGTRILYDWGAPKYIGMLQVATGETMRIVRHSKHGLIQARFSPDDRWISFLRMGATVRSQVMVAPFLGAAVIPDSQWIPITDGAASDFRPRWSPDGNLIYYHSDRDGFRCLWAQRLDPATKRPAGAPIEVRHFHSPGLSLQSPGLFHLGIAIARDRIALSLLESTGNIWTFKLPEER